MPPRLTIAIPTLNRANLLGRAIDSALAQTSSDIEIIVSDNASTDDTPSVLRPYENRGVRIFRQPKTIPASRNGEFLMREARGEFFVGLSDDDYLEPEFVAKVLALYDRHPELSFVYTGCAVHYDDVQVPALVGPEVESGLDFLLGHYEDRREVSWCACVTRVRDLRTLGPQPDDRVIGDMYFWTKMAFLGPVGCVPEVVSHYILFRKQNDNISHGTSPLGWTREVQLLANEVTEGARRAGASAEYMAKLRGACRKHVARSAANQFVWTRIRGASVADAWRWLPECVRQVNLNSTALIRMGAAITLPRSVLRALLMKGARRSAVSRVSQETHVAHKRESRFYMAAGAGVFQRLVQVASTLILMPLLLRTLGVAKFGIWGSASSLAWFSGLVDIGIGTALVTLIARSKAAGNDEEARTHLTGALTFGGAIALAMLAVAAALFWGLGAKAQFEPYFIAVVGLALNVPLNSANNAWMALQKGYVSGLWELVQTLLTLGGVIAFSTATTDVVFFVAIVYGAMVAANVGSLLHLLIIHSELRPHRRAPFSEVRAVLHEGFLLFALNLVGGLTFLLDNVLALQLLGPEASAKMTIALRICMAGLGFLLVISQPLWPAFTEAAAKMDKPWIRRSFIRGTALLLAISAAGSLILLICGERLLRLWLHATLEVDPPLLWAISAWVIAQAVIRVPHLFLNAISAMRYQLLVMTISTGIALVLKFALSRNLYVAGFLWSTTATVIAIVAPTFLWRAWSWYSAPHPLSR